MIDVKTEINEIDFKLGLRPDPTGKAYPKLSKPTPPHWNWRR